MDERPPLPEHVAVVSNRIKDLVMDHIHPSHSRSLVVFSGKDLTHLPLENFNDHVIIKFPEDGLHPYWHMYIAEEIVELLNSGDSCHIALLTNSAYIIDHLNNMIKAYQVGNITNTKYFLKITPMVFLNPKYVRAFEFKDGKKLCPTTMITI